jgi:hypothetical protein
VTGPYYEDEGFFTHDMEPRLSPACPDWPHSYICPECGGNGCGACNGTGERNDWSDCTDRHRRDRDDDRP